MLCCRVGECWRTERHSVVLAADLGGVDFSPPPLTALDDLRTLAALFLPFDSALWALRLAA